MRKILIFTGGAIIIGVGIWLGILLLNNKSDSTSGEKWPKEAMLQAIVKDRPSLTLNGRPVIEVSNVTEPESGWYVVTIKSIHEENMEVPVKAVLIDKNGSGTSNSFTLLLGPDTYFQENKMLSLNLPDSVILELRKR